MPEEQKDEFFAQVPNDVVERLVIRPEDTLPRVEESIKTYKQALLSVLEVFFFNLFLFSRNKNILIYFV